MSASKQWRTNGVFVLVVLVGLIFAGPASASHYRYQGGGATTGYELGPNWNEMCKTLAGQADPSYGLHFPTTYYELTGASVSYVIRNSAGTILAYYTGPVSMEAHHGSMVAAAQAAKPGPCDPTQPVVAAPIPLTDGSVVGTSGAGSVNCQMPTDNGTYLRQNTDQVTIEFNLVCNIVGNVVAGTVNNVTVRHYWTGTQTPCFQVVCLNPDAGGYLDGSYLIMHP